MDNCNILSECLFMIILSYHISIDYISSGMLEDITLFANCSFIVTQFFVYILDLNTSQYGIQFVKYLYKIYY